MRHLSKRAPLGCLIGLAGVLALVLDGFALWLCFIYAPAKFDTNLAVIVRQFPDVGLTLVPVLALAIIWPVPRTLWLLLTTWVRPFSHPPYRRMR